MIKNINHHQYHKEKSISKGIRSKFESKIIETALKN